VAAQKPGEGRVKVEYDDWLACDHLQTNPDGQTAQTRDGDGMVQDAEDT
jgi:hypothetical protein